MFEATGVGAESSLVKLWEIEQQLEFKTERNKIILSCSITHSGWLLQLNIFALTIFCFDF